MLVRNAVGSAAIMALILIPYCVPLGRPLMALFLSLKCHSKDGDANGTHCKMSGDANSTFLVRE